MVHNRQSIRLPWYDYSQNGAYFVTICTQNKELLFGEIIQGTKYGEGTKCSVPTVELTDFWKIAEQCWHEIPHHYPDVELDAFVVMPNLIHGIICMYGYNDKNVSRSGVGAQNSVPRVQNIEPLRENAYKKIISWSLGSIIRGYKIGVTKWCRNVSGRAQNIVPLQIWQRNFYEYIIRNEEDLNRIREYIMNNPVNWMEDEMNQGP